MTSHQKERIRLATAIHAQLTAHRHVSRLTDLPTNYWQRCEALVHKLRRTELHQWQLAGDVVRCDLRHNVTALQIELADLAQQLSAAGPITSVTTLADIYQDLVALEAEFEKLESDRQAKVLAVTTEPIHLEGRYLGAFEIRLDWSQLATDAHYRVIALDPQPAASRDNVTHPHVLEEVLCEGDGRTAIRQALLQGRLLDFFTLVAGVLRTYNPDSPFVELARWDGEACRDCGAVVDDEYRYACENCDRTTCDECVMRCYGCESTFCSGCVSCCAACDNDVCRGCLRRCQDCHERVCSACIHNNQRCPNCHDQHERLETEGESPEDHDPTVHTDGLGQTPLPA